MTIMTLCALMREMAHDARQSNPKQHSMPDHSPDYSLGCKIFSKHLLGSA